MQLDWTADEVSALREALRLSVGEFARVVGVNRRSVLLWERGQTRSMHASSRRLLDKVLEEASTDTVQRFRRATDRDHTVVPAKLAVEDDMKRRDLLAYLGAGITAPMADMITNEPNRMVAALDATSVSERRLSYFEELVSELGRRVVRTPPRPVLGPAIENFRMVRTCLSERQTTYHQMRLVRVAGRLANVVGEILFNEGHFDHAQHWYMTAIHAAQDIGDQYSEDIALAGLAYLPTYSGDPARVLSLLQPRLDKNPTTGAAVAWMWGMAARAHAELGDEHRFQSCITKAASALDKAGAEEIDFGIFSFRPEKLAFYEAIGHSRFGHIEQTSAASQRAMALYDPQETTEPALVRLEYASALLTAGEVDEACAVATSAVTDERTFLGATVTGRAQRFDAALKGIDSRTVSSWREQALPALEAVRV